MFEYSEEDYVKKKITQKCEITVNRTQKSPMLDRAGGTFASKITPLPLRSVRSDLLIGTSLRESELQLPLRLGLQRHLLFLLYAF